MMIILNECEYAEQRLKNNDIGEKPYITISIIAKYLYHKMGYRKKKIIEALTSFMEKSSKDYLANRHYWDGHIEKIASNAGKYELFEIDGVWITKAEFAKIAELQDQLLEKLTFTLLCLAKLYNLRNPNNNSWVNNEVREVFKLARISCRTDDMYEYLCELEYEGYLESPKRNDNLSNRVTFAEADGEKILLVSDFRELGYEYLKYRGGNYTACTECGALFPNNKYGNRKFCDRCRAYTKIEQKSLICIDCGEMFTIGSKNSRAKRCPSCQKAYRTQYKHDHYMKRIRQTI